MATQERVGKIATTVSRDKNGTIRVVYHATTVVQVSKNGTIILDHNGWKTATTKTRMNQASNQFNLGYVVYKKDNEWFVSFKGRDIPFKEKPLTLRPGK